MNILPAEELASPPVSLLRGSALFLDFDGTLVELADNPDGVSVSDELIALLGRLNEALQCRLAIVSGRNCERLDRFGLGDFMRAGSHGLEILAPGAVICRPERNSALDEILDRFNAFAENKPGVVIEPKPFSVGIHYRQAADHGEAANALAEKLAEEAGLFVQHGKLMAEIRPASGDKGEAINTVMQLPDFAGHVPVFLGDDTTDEDGFAAVQELGGHGIFIGSSGRSCARYRLDDVAAVHQWLKKALAALSNETQT